MTAALEDGKVTPWTRFVVPRPDLRLRRRGHAQGRPRARHRDDDRHADPGAVEQHRRLQDRAAGRQGPPAGLDTSGSASARRPASTSPARRRGYVLPGDKWYGSGILNVPDRPGRQRHAHPAHPRLRGDRQRRAPGDAPPGEGRRGGVGAADHARGDRRRRSTGCSARWCPTRAPASSPRCKGYEVAGKTGTAEKIDPLTGQLQRHALHVVVRRLRPGGRPAAADRGGRRRAHRPLLRRRRRGTGVREDRRVLPAKHENPAVSRAEGLW